jgi:hypothetical protein
LGFGMTFAYLIALQTKTAPAGRASRDRAQAGVMATNLDPRGS